MLGAILGDIIGSPYEFNRNNIKTTDFPLFCKRSQFTDDTVMAIAVAEGLMNGYDDSQHTEKEIISAMQKYGRMYPNAGYGARFSGWLESRDPKPYNSYGNGSAMRVSAVAWLFDDLSQVEDYALISAHVSHDHTEGIKGAKATVAAIFMARTGKSKNDIKQYIEKTYGYNLNRKLDEIRPSYHHVESCQETVPEAIIAFLESDGFEDAIRKAVSLGGDSDTLTAITGSIAEGYYDIPVELKQKALSMLDKPLLAVIKRWREWMAKKRADYQKYQRALEYATEMHTGQKRIGGADYITHPVAVVKLMREQLLPIEYQIARLFHDLLEDTNATVSKITELGGSDVADAVQLLTKEPGYLMFEYIARIKANPIAKAVKAADRFHNLKCAIVADETFKRKYIKESIDWYLDFSTLHIDIQRAIEELAQTLAKPFYELLFPYIKYFDQRPKFEWGGGKQKDGTFQLPFPIYSETIIQFEKMFYLSGIADGDYMGTIERYGIQADHDSFAKAIPTADAKLLTAMLTCYIRQERFCDGLIATAVENGNIANILMRLQETQEEMP